MVLPISSTVLYSYTQCHIFLHYLNSRHSLTHPTCTEYRLISLVTSILQTECLSLRDDHLSTFLGCFSLPLGRRHNDRSKRGNIPRQVCQSYSLNCSTDINGGAQWQHICLPPLRSAVLTPDPMWEI